MAFVVLDLEREGEDLNESTALAGRGTSSLCSFGSQYPDLCVRVVHNRHAWFPRGFTPWYGDGAVPRPLADAGLLRASILPPPPPACARYCPSRLT